MVFIPTPTITITKNNYNNNYLKKEHRHVGHPDDDPLHPDDDPPMMMMPPY